MAGKETHETGSDDAATVLFQVDDPLSMAARSVTKQFGRARKECCHAGTLRGPEKTGPIILGEVVLLFDTVRWFNGKRRRGLTVDPENEVLEMVVRRTSPASGKTNRRIPKTLRHVTFKFLASSESGPLTVSWCF